MAFGMTVSSSIEVVNKVEQQVLEFCATSPASAKAIASKCDLPLSTVYSVTAKLIKRGLLLRVKEEGWAAVRFTTGREVSLAILDVESYSEEPTEIKFRPRMLIPFYRIAEQYVSKGYATPNWSNLPVGFAECCLRLASLAEKFNEGDYSQVLNLGLIRETMTAILEELQDVVLLGQGILAEATVWDTQLAMYTNREDWSTDFTTALEALEWTRKQSLENIVKLGNEQGE